MNSIATLCVFVMFMLALGATSRVPRAASRNCPKNIDFPSGRVKYRRKGTRATFKCPRGSDLYGKKNWVCGQDNKWKGDGLPLCVKSGCAPIDNSNDLNLVMSTHPLFDDAVITFSCEEGYLLFGPTEIHCDGVKWSHAPPTCKAVTDLMSCDFEEDLCGWTQSHNDLGNRNWTRHIGPTQTGATGPKRDHTLPNSDTGHYMFFESSTPTAEGDRAVLVSPPYTADLSPMCFELWYHMLGPEEQGHVGSLAVYVKSESDQFQTLQPMFYKEGNQGDEWHRGDIFIDDAFESYQIIIKATRKISYMSDIAIDDLRLYNCTQTKTTTVATTTTTTTTTTPVPTTIIVTTQPAFSSPNATEQPASTVSISTGPSNGSQPPAVANSTVRSTTTTVLPVDNSTTLTTTNVSKIVSTAEIKTFPVSTVSSSPLTSNSTTAGPKTSSTAPVVNITTIETTSESTTTTAKIPMTTQQVTNVSTKRVTKATRPLTTKMPITTEITTRRPKSTRTATSTITPTYTTTVKVPTVTTGKRTTKAPPTQSTTPSPSTFAVTTTRRTTLVTTPIPSTATTTPPTTSPSKASPSTAVSTQSSSPVPSSSSVSSTQALTSTTDKYKSSTHAPNSSVKFASSSIAANASKTLTTTTPFVSTLSTEKTDGNSSVSVKEQRSKHPADETLKPLMIGLAVGIIVGLIIIGVIGWVCMRRRKFYTSRYEDELKPITNAASTHSLNQDEYYHDDFDIEHV